MKGNDIISNNDNSKLFLNIIDKLYPVLLVFHQILGITFTYYSIIW